MKRSFLRFGLALGLLGLSSVGALAACGGTTAQVTDAAAATRQMALINDPTGTNCAGVTASDIRYLAGTALASPSAYGSAPSGQVIGVNAYVTNTITAVGNNVTGVTPAAGAGSPVIAYNYTYNSATGQWDQQTSTATVLDPCQSTAKTTVPFTLATAAVKVAITGVSAKKIYVCAFDLQNNAADSVAIFEATTATVCATSAVAVVGAGTSVATAATGYNFAANGGITRGNGANQILQTSVNANDLCIAQSAATQLSGSFTYVTR